MVPVCTLQQTVKHEITTRNMERSMTCFLFHTVLQYHMYYDTDCTIAPSRMTQSNGIY